MRYRISDIGYRIWPIMLAMVAVFLTGCPKPGERNLNGDAPAAEAVTYPQFAAAYNRRVGKIERLWARVTMEVRWVDEQGNKHFEQGDGQLIVRKPDEMALAIGRLGNTMYWLGCDAKRYWMFELNPPKDQPRTAYIGSRALAHRHRLPWPIHPDQLLGILGISPINQEMPDDDVRWHVDGQQGTLQSHAEPSNGSQVVFDVKYQRLLQRTVSRGENEVLLYADLSKYKPLKLVNKPPGAFPDVATRFELKLPPQQAQLSMTLSEMTNDPSKIRDVQFNFEKLIKALKVEPKDVIDLDRMETSDQPPAETDEP